MNKQDYQAYLDSLVVGDVITYVTHSWGMTKSYIAKLTVTKRTPKQIVCTGENRVERRFYANGGNELGRQFSQLPHPATPERIAEVELEVLGRNLVYQLSNANFRGMPVEALQEIKALVDKYAGVPQ